MNLMRLPWRRSKRGPVECPLVLPTTKRPHSQGSYIVRLSEENRKRLGVGNLSYLKIAYGRASVLGRLVVDHELDDRTICMDQTHRVALGLEGILQGQSRRGLIYGEAGGGVSPAELTDISQPIRITTSKFRGPNLLERLLRYQYIVCRVHVALNVDMEKPIARLSENSLEVIGVAPGDKVRVIGELSSRSVRCLALSSISTLPSEDMKRAFGEPFGAAVDSDSGLPWCTLDKQTRDELDVKPWDNVLVSRSLWQVLASEFRSVGLAISLSLVGVALSLPNDGASYFPVALIGLGLVMALLLILVQVRSRL